MPNENDISVALLLALAFKEEYRNSAKALVFEVRLYSHPSDKPKPTKVV